MNPEWGKAAAPVAITDIQRIPKTYLSAPVIFPYLPRSCGILGATTAIHGIAENGEILSRIIPEECCWFAGQSRCGVPRISENVVNCTSFLDCSHHAREKEWFCPNNTIVHPAGVQAVLRQRENCEKDRNYVLIEANSNGHHASIDSLANNEFDNETRKQMRLKIEGDGSLKHSNVPLNVSSIKKDENVE